MGSLMCIAQRSQRAKGPGNWWWFGRDPLPHLWPRCRPRRRRGVSFPCNTNKVIHSEFVTGTKITVISFPHGVIWTAT